MRWRRERQCLPQGLGWITGLSAGTRTSFVDFSIFQVMIAELCGLSVCACLTGLLPQVSLSVTPLGLEQWRQAVEVLYAHIHLIKQVRRSKVAIPEILHLTSVCAHADER